MRWFRLGSICLSTNRTLVVLAICCVLCFNYHILHCCYCIFLVDFILPFLLTTMLSSLFSFFLLGLMHLSLRSFETTSLPPRGSGKIWLHSTLFKPHFVEFHWVCCCIRSCLGAKATYFHVQHHL